MVSFSLKSDYYNWFLQPVTGTITSDLEESIELQASLYLLSGVEEILEWSVPVYFGACTFDVYKSETEYGPWSKINLEPLTGNYLRMQNKEGRLSDSKYSSNFFIIECTKSDSTKVRSKIITLQNNQSKWVSLRTREIQRREWWLLTKYAGVSSVVFRRKTFGKRCPACWDERSNKVLKDNCPTCLGTSFEGGYFPGYSTYIQYEPTPNNTVFSYQGRQESNQIPAWTIGYPEVNNFDIILRVPDWKIYRVDAVQTTELQTVPVRQLFTLTELSKNTIEYKLIDQITPSGLWQ